MPFEDIHNLEQIAFIPEEDDVAFESEAAYVGP
jgi:hypothetical protein